MSDEIFVATTLPSLSVWQLHSAQGNLMEIFCIYSDESFKQCIRLKDKAFKNCKCDMHFNN